jgi:hypothetical protein
MSMSSEAGDDDQSDVPLFDAERREKLLSGHPVRGGDYTLPTPMMQRTYALVRELVWARRTGTVFYASPRMGKTRCALAIRDLLRQEFPNVYVTLLSTRPSGRPTTAHMLRLILEAETHALSRRPDADQLFGNAIADIRVKAARIGARQYVLLIELELQDLRMTAISFAQPEILHRRTSLLASNARQIIGRFLSNTLQFDGCASEDDFGALLCSYDQASEYPDGSGITYTQFFFPEAFRAGFRLEDSRRAIWEALRSAAGGDALQGVPMEHVCLTIDNLLLSLRRDDCPNFRLSSDDIGAAVSESQLKSFSDVLS